MSQHEHSRYRVERVVRLMCRCAGQPLTVGDLAAAVGVSERTLHADFQRFGVTPMTCLLSIRLTGAYADLQAAHHRETTVAAVGHRWGFSTASDFATRFRKAFGQSPSTILRLPPTTSTATHATDCRVLPAPDLPQYAPQQLTSSATHDRPAA